MPWYALRDLTRPNSKSPAYKVLAEAGLEVFTPLKEELRIVHGRRVRESVPLIHDLVFVRSQREEIDPFIEKIATLQFRFVAGAGYQEPMTVPELQMERFINAVRTMEQPHYYLPGEITPAMCKGPVRIVGGALDGYDGTLLQVRGSRKKLLLLSLPGFFSVGIEVDPEYICRLETAAGKPTQATTATTSAGKPAQATTATTATGKPAAATAAQASAAATTATAAAASTTE